MTARVWTWSTAVVIAAGVAWAQQGHPPVPVPVPHLGPRVHAPLQPAQIDVIVIEAGAGDAGVDAALAGLAQLRRGPFAMFPSMRQVSRTTLPLGEAPSVATLPNGTATFTLEDRESSGRYRFRVHLAQGARGSDLTFVANPGQPLFTVRSSRADRAMILGFVVHP